MQESHVYGIAIVSNFLFSTASLIFSQYAKRFSPFWMNQFKVSVAFLAFTFTLFIMGENLSVSPFIWISLLVSGMIGLCIGDQFLIKAYTTLGPSRSLVLYSFQPLLLGIYGWFFLNQGFTLSKVFAILCMISCVLVFVLERNKLTGKWDLASFGWAFTGIVMDAVGVMLTRSAYESNMDLSSFQVNTIRALGALIGFFIIKPKSYLKLFNDVKALTKKDFWIITSASFCGTFLSLSLYLMALKYAHVASLSSIAMTGPLWVSVLECIWFKKLPTVWQLAAFVLFITGFYLM